MKTSRILSFVLMLIVQTASTLLFAQIAGDMICGVLYDNDGPLMMINVTERDSADRIVAHTTTDMEGHFFFHLVDPSDSITIVYMGYEPVTLPIDRTCFEIEMKRKVIGTKEVYPIDRGMVGTKTDYMEKINQYAPEGFVCGYIMSNAWEKYLWGLFLVKEGYKYSVVYKESDKTEKRNINNNLAKELETSVNNKIAGIEKAASTPIIVNEYEFEKLDDAILVYEMNYAYVVTPDKAAYFWAWNDATGKYRGIEDDIWQQEFDKFKKEDE